MNNIDAIKLEEERNYEFLQKYMMYCKNIIPKFSDEANQMIIEYYKNVKMEYGSLRILESLRNIAIAFAKLKQKEIVDDKDVEDVIALYKIQLKSMSKFVDSTVDPRSLAVREIIRLVRNSEYEFDFKQ